MEGAKSSSEARQGLCSTCGQPVLAESVYMYTCNSPTARPASSSESRSQQHTQRAETNMQLRATKELLMGSAGFAEQPAVQSEQYMHAGVAMQDSRCAAAQADGQAGAYQKVLQFGMQQNHTVLESSGWVWGLHVGNQER